MMIDTIGPRNAVKWHGKRIGLLGGSFNPAHGGHLHISEQALKRLGLDAVWWLVSPQNPLKPQKGMAPLATRMASAQHVGNHPDIVVTDIEARLGTRYTADTITKLIQYFPNSHFIWLMGADNLVGFHRWKSWQRIAKMLPIAVLLRPGYSGARWSTPSASWFGKYRHAESHARQWHTWRTPALVIVTLPLDARSATAIRVSCPDWATNIGSTNAESPAR